MGKTFDEQIKAIEDQEKKQVDTLNTFKYDDDDDDDNNNNNNNNNEKLDIKNDGIIPESAIASNEARKRLNKMKEKEKNDDREKLIYKTSKCPYGFRKFNTIRTFGEDIYDGKITLEEADES